MEEKIQMKKNRFQNPSLLFKIEDCLTYKFGSERYKKFIKGIRLKGEEKVIEFGSGGGSLTSYLVKKIPKGKITCVDISDYFLKKAKKRLKEYKNIEFKKNLSSLRKNNYDVTIVHFVLHDIEEKQKEKIIKDLSSKLKKRGYLYIKEPISKSHGMPSEEIEKLMKKAKLKKIFSKEEKSKGSKTYFGVFAK